MMLVGRVIFGMGGECMCVAQSAIIATWFKGSELAFAYGINLSVSRLGSVLNAMIIPSLYDQKGLGPALFLGFLICVFSFFNALGMIYLDKKAEEKNPNERAEVSEEDKFKFSDIY
jgi:MFS family permease